MPLLAWDLLMLTNKKEERLVHQVEVSTVVAEERDSSDYLDSDTTLERTIDPNQREEVVWEEPTNS